MEVINYFDRVSSGNPARFGFDSTLKRLQAVKPKPDPTKHENEFADLFKASCCKFCKTPGNEDFLAVANEEGFVRIENTKRDRKIDVEFRAHNNNIFDLDWSDCDNRLILGSADQTTSMWDVREGGVTKIKNFLAHDMSVRSVTFRPLDKDVFATGARDGRVVIWDVRTASPDVAQICVKPENFINIVPAGNSANIIYRSKQHQAAHSICSLLFQDDVHLFCSSIAESSIYVWDLRKNYSFLKRVPSPLYKLTHPEPSLQSYYTSMCLDSTGTRLYTNSKDGSMHCFNVASYSSKPVAKYTGHFVSSNYINCCLSPDDRYLLSGSGGGHAHMWSTARPGPAIGRLNAHARLEVSCVDWSRAAEYKIATCYDASDFVSDSEDETAFTEQLMVWKVATETDDLDKTKLKDDEIGTISWQAASEQAFPIRRTFSSYHRACRPLVKERPPITELNSPTVNLPNHVIDGTSPLHRCSPSSRKEKENRNWLSSLKKKTPKTPSSLNSKSVQIKKNSREHKPKACGNLLKFFKAAARVSSPVDSLTEVGNFAESPSLMMEI